MSDKVVIYQHGNYEGASQELGVGSYDINTLSIGNDQLSSLKVPKGMRVTLYEHGGFTGRTKSFTDDTPWVGDEFNDLTSSIKVEQLQKVVIYQHGNYEGASQELGVGSYDINTLSIGNDQLSSLKVPKGMRVTLYEHGGFTGRTKSFTDDTPWVGNEFNDLTSSIKVEQLQPEFPASMYQITGFRDIEDLKHRIASDPTVISKLASFAHMLGFGWCGGTQTGKVGMGFDVSKSGDSYILQAHYNPGDPYASGYWADKRLKITLSNFRILIDPATLVYGKPLISSLNPIAINTYTAKNSSPNEDSIQKTFTYQLSTTISHTTSFSFTEGIKVSVKNKAEVPFFGETEVATEFSFSATQGWSHTTSTTHGTADSVTYTGKIPGKSKRLLTLVALSTQSQIGYTTQAVIAFNVSFHGFLRWSGNARNDHPGDRPFVTVNFGDDRQSAFEDIVDKHDHSSIPKYSDWDWNWMQGNFGSWLDSVISFFRGGIGVPLSGKFTNVKGTNVEIKAGDPQPLTDANLLKMPARQAMVLPVHAEVSPPHPAPLLLQSDELPGARVLSVE